MNKVQPSILPGFMELLPNDQHVLDTMRNIIEKHFKKYAFLHIDTPIIERSDVLLAKGGGETSKQVYHIDHESKNMSLRFDLTVPLARYVAEHYHDIEFPFRRYQIGKVYRGERNQKGRYKEFYQCDIDIIGNDVLDIRNDAEIPAIIYDIFRELNFTNISFHINNRKLLNGLFEALEINQGEEVLRILDKIKKVRKDVFVEMLKEADCNDQQINQLMDFILFKGSNQEVLQMLNRMDLQSELFREGLFELTEVYEYMGLFNIPDANICLDLSITRGLDYYTGTVYETFLNDYESIGSICSGGRYENLALNYTNNKLPGVGISIGLTRLFYQLSAANLINYDVTPAIDVLVIPMLGYEKYGASVVTKFREANITAQLHVEEQKIKKKFNYADKLNIPYVAILGEEEYNKSSISLKNLETGHQEILSVEDAISCLKEIKQGK